MPQTDKLYKIVKSGTKPEHAFRFLGNYPFHEANLGAYRFAWEYVRSNDGVALEADSYIGEYRVVRQDNDLVVRVFKIVPIDEEGE